MTQEFLEQTARDYDMPISEVERIAKFHPYTFYDKLEEYILKEANRSNNPNLKQTKMEAIQLNIFKDFIELIDIENPNFQNVGKVHDWRNYVPYEWQEKWFEFTERERQIIAVMAETQADKEEWD